MHGLQPAFLEQYVYYILNSRANASNLILWRTKSFKWHYGIEQTLDEEVEQIKINDDLITTMIHERIL